MEFGGALVSHIVRGALPWVLAGLLLAGGAIWGWGALRYNAGWNDGRAALVALTARLCGQYAIPVQYDTVLSHAEVQRTLKVTQRGKWDITWLPGMTQVGDPVAVGDGLRDRVIEALSSNQFESKEPANPIIKLFQALLAFFRGRA